MDLKNLKDLSVKYLSYRPRSVTEVTTYLRSKTSDQTLINETIDFLKKYKLLDDEAFAKWLVESRSRSRPRGARLLQQELKSKGIELSTINYQLSTQDDKSLALQALQKKLSLWSKLSAKDFKIKATRYLAARGFSWSVIAETVKNRYNHSDVNK